MVLCAIVLTLALPLRAYLGQRAEISRLQAEQAAQQRRVGELELRSRQLDDPAYIRDQARTRLHYTEPGETAYIVLPPSAPPAHRPPTDSRAAVPPGNRAWYAQLWASTAAAGTAAAESGPTPPAPVPLEVPTRP